MAEIPPIEKGQIITAKRLNDYAEGINDLNRVVFDGARQLDDPVEPDVQAAAEEEPEEPVVEGANEYTETARSTSTVIVYDDAFTNYAEIQRIESITFTNSLGETLKLTFTGNPTPPSPP